MRNIFRTVLVVLLLGSTSHAQTLREGYVLRVEGRLAFIDLGSQHEVIPDDVFEVVRQETIIHPVTGENLGGEVPLGVIRVVEIFPRLSTAEIVSLEPGVGLRTLDAEAKQGLVRIKPATQAKVDEIQARPNMSMERVFVPVRPSGKANPDGALRGIIPELKIDMGSKVDTELPDRTYKLVGDPLLLAEADTSGAAALPNINGAATYALGLTYPVSPRWSLTLDLSVGSHSLIAIGGRIYPGSLMDGAPAYTPLGRVGEPVVTVALGTGGFGATSLTPAMELDLVALPGLTAPVDFKPDSNAAIRDSLYTVAITDSLRKVAGDSLSSIAKRGLGIAFGLVYPMTPRMVWNAGYQKFGNFSQVALGLTYYLQPLGAGDRNPDGVLRSLIVRGEGIWDIEASSILFDLGVRMPLASTLTAGLDVVTDFSGYARVGIALKGYFGM